MTDLPDLLEHLARVANGLESIAKRIRDEGPRAVENAEAWKGAGYRSAPGSGRGREISRPTETAALGRPKQPGAERAMHAAESLNHELWAVEAHAKILDRFLDDLKVVAPLEDRPPCDNCGQPANWPDRWNLKDGRCVQCYLHRRDHGHDRLLDLGRLSDEERRKCLICERGECETCQGRKAS